MRKLTSTGASRKNADRLKIDPDLAEQLLAEAVADEQKKGARTKTIERVVIQKPQRAWMRVTVEGDTSLISHAFSHAIEEQVFASKEGVRGKKQSLPPRDPQAAFKNSIYYGPGGQPSFPASAFKRASVDACSFLDNATQVRMRGSFYVLGDYIVIERSKPKIRKDITRIGRMKNIPDLRWRAEFAAGWQMTFDIMYAADVISAEDIVNVIDRAGFHVGIGDWRPQRNGNHGMFHVVNVEVPDVPKPRTRRAKKTTKRTTR